MERKSGVREHQAPRPLRMPATPFDPAALARHGSRRALVADGVAVGYDELAERVERRSRQLGTQRGLVVLVGARHLEFVVTLLAALHGRHPVMIVDGDAGAASVSGFDPDVIVRTQSDGVDLERRMPASPRPLHDDLALMSSTSGSTGAGKLVRLSLDAVVSNAAAIADYLDLGPRDVGISSLPFQYCYGLSVLTSHLAVGASVVLSDLSVVDPCFADLVDRHGVTGLAGVPHTFEMLETGRSDLLAKDSLRYVTQAGGRLAPEHVLRLAESSRSNGVEVFVMYGQTEATARMAYLSPTEVFEAPDSVGRAIPGGSIRIADPDSTGAGEVVYRGPNVMMGYAVGPGDLARGHDLTELRTGDRGRLDDAGRLLIVGRSSRILKIHGKRIDLDHLQNELALVGPPVHCAGDDDGLVVACVVADTEPGGRDRGLERVAAEMASIPAGRVRAVRLAALPRTSSGKVDSPALVGLARADDEPHDGDGTEAEDVRDVFRVVFDRSDIDPGQSFASMGGDSFSYVEMSMRLERCLGSLPSGWHVMSISELERVRSEPTPRPRWTAEIDTSVVIRAIAIVTIVLTHMRIFRVAGGAHTLLAVLGWNFARFQLSEFDVPGRFRRSMETVARIAVPTSVWIGLNMLVAGGYGLAALTLTNNYLGEPARRDGRWEYWYFEAFVQASVVLAVVFAIPAVRRWERRGPFLFALGVLGLTWVVRFDVVQWGDPYNEVFRPHSIAAFIALGWCAQRAAGSWQKLVVTAATVVTTFGYFDSVGYTDQFDREARIALMICALVWIPTVRIPRIVSPVVATVAAASMWIFLVHWQVWPALTPIMDDDVAFLLTIASGVAVWWVAERTQERIARRRVHSRRWGTATPEV